MKKSIFIAVLGVAAVAATSSYGQGYVVFSSYVANAGVGAFTGFFASPSTGVAGSSYTASLYYALGTVTDPVNGTAQSITSPVSGAFTLYTGANATSTFNTPSSGYFDGGLATIPNYSSGPISFEIWVTGPNEVGRSGAWTESSIIASSAVPAGNFGDNGVMPNFLVAPVPEPTTLALAGLGGLASLVALRRKQA
jgi:hypothetical protein